jgi:hypothetical protein
MSEPPHFRVPFEIGPDGQVKTDPQGSDREIQSCISVVLSASFSDDPAVRDRGVPKELVHDKTRRPALLAEVRRREPRATEALLNGVLDQPEEFPLPQ